MRLLIYISVVLFLCFNADKLRAQNYLQEAYDHYKGDAFEEARIDIDSAILTDARFDSQTWQLRGLIYKKIGESQYSLLSRAIESFVQAREINGDETDKINGYLENTLLVYYNFAVTSIEALELETSEVAYMSYKSNYYKYLNDQMNFNSTDIQYYQVLGENYLIKAKSFLGDEKLELSRKAAASFEKVLKIDSVNFEANFGAGIAYYNLGADLVNNITLLSTPASIDMVVEAAEMSDKYFNLALPYIQAAHYQRPNHVKVIEGLAGIYYGLNDKENFDFFNEKYLKLKKEDE